MGAYQGLVPAFIGVMTSMRAIAAPRSLLHDALQVKLHLKEDQLEFLEERRLKVRLFCMQFMDCMAKLPCALSLQAGCKRRTRRRLQRARTVALCTWFFLSFTSSSA